MAMPKYDHDIPHGSPSQEMRANFCPTDQYLRGCGFRLHSRPRDGEPVWERGGKKYKQAEALRLAGYESAQRA